MEFKLTDEQFTAFIEECMTKYQNTHGVSHRRIVWTDIDEIIDILNQLCQKAPLFNIFFPHSGLGRFEKVSKAKEEGFIEIITLSRRYIKPKQLILEYIPDFTMWSYFRLESEPMQPLNGYGNTIFGYNELAQLDSGEYVSYDYIDSSEFQDTEENFKYVSRHFEGDFVIVPVNSPYNRISQSTDDGRHSDLTKEEFDFYITRCVGNWKLLHWTQKNYQRHIAEIKRIYAKKEAIMANQ